MICPPPPPEAVETVTTRPLPNGEHNDPRLPSPGSAVVRQYKGQQIRVTRRMKRPSLRETKSRAASVAPLGDQDHLAARPEGQPALHLISEGEAVASALAAIVDRS